MWTAQTKPLVRVLYCYQYLKSSRDYSNIAWKCVMELFSDIRLELVHKRWNQRVIASIRCQAPLDHNLQDRGRVVWKDDMY